MEVNEGDLLKDYGLLMQMAQTKESNLERKQVRSEPNVK